MIVFLRMLIRLLTAASAVSVPEAGFGDPTVAARLLPKDDKPASKPKSKRPPAKSGSDEISRELSFQFE